MPRRPHGAVGYFGWADISAVMMLADGAAQARAVSVTFLGFLGMG